MSGRFPGAANLDQLWQNLCNAVESISFFTPEELGPGVDENLRNDPDYVRARGLIDGADLFDAAFFGISPLEAKVMDPQQRVFLELTQQALENAAVDPERYPGRIGVFAGLGDNHYYTTNLLTHPDLLAMAGKLAVEYGNQKDYIALRAAYLLDLRGPAVSVNTACSTTLLTVDQAFSITSATSRSPAASTSPFRRRAASSIRRAAPSAAMATAVPLTPRPRAPCSRTAPALSSSSACQMRLKMATASTPSSAAAARTTTVRVPPRS
jgi:hypothetical protein